MIEKKMEEAKQRFALLEVKNAAINETLEKTAGDLREKQSEAERLRRDNLAGKNKYRELEGSKAALARRIDSLNNVLTAFNAEKTDLAGIISTLQERNELLRRDLERAHSFHYDQPMVTASRGKKDKLMSRARRTQKLRATVFLPDNLKDIQFKVTAPDGKMLNNDDGISTVQVLNSNKNLTASLSSGQQSFKEVEMTFLTKKRLQPGTYTIQVQSELLPVGTIRLQLR